ncbi:hypothetical protein ACOMHN_023606 [Nucella lapillus]
MGSGEAAEPVQMPSRRRPEEEEGNVEVDDYTIAAVLIAVFLVIVIVIVVICSCCQRHSLSHHCRHCMLCPCQKRNRREDSIMGYFPANITVNSAALEQGVPDIFLRDSQTWGRISIDPYSFDNSHSRELDSTTETSGAWSEYLHRAVGGITRKKNSDLLESTVPEDPRLTESCGERLPQCTVTQSGVAENHREVLVENDVIGNESGDQEDVMNDRCCQSTHVAEHS